VGFVGVSLLEAEAVVEVEGGGLALLLGWGRADLKKDVDARRRIERCWASVVRVQRRR